MVNELEEQWVGFKWGDESTYVVESDTEISVFDSKSHPGLFDWVLGFSDDPIAVSSDSGSSSTMAASYLPDDFRALACTNSLQELVAEASEASPVGCWFEFGSPVSNVLEDGDMALLFYRDQQEVVQWYYHTTRKGASGVLASWGDLEIGIANAEAGTVYAELHPDTIRLVASSVSNFIDRIWGESMAVAKLRGNLTTPIDDASVDRYASYLSGIGY